MHTNTKKLLSFILVCAMVSSLLVTAVASLLPMAVYAAGETISYTDAPYAGVYQVTSDKAVTLTSEIGSTVTLQAGGTGYIYLIQGANGMTSSNTNATLTFTALDGNGMDYFDQVSIPEYPIPDGDSHLLVSGLYKNLAPGEVYTFTFDTNNFGGWNGLVYPYIYLSDGNTVSIKVESDTGFYAELSKSGYANTLYETAPGNQDMEFLYLRAGANQISIENTGSVNTTIGNISMNSVGPILSNETWASQANVANLKVIDHTIVEETPTPSPTPTAKPDNIITYDAPYAGVFQVTSNKAVTLESEIGTTATLAANGSAKYIYLVKGENDLTTTDNSATLTFTPLENNGLDYLDQVTVSEIPLSVDNTEDQLPLIYEETEGGFSTNGSTYFQMDQNSSVVFSLDAPSAGLYAIKIQINDSYAGSLKVETDTGFYGIINQSQYGWNLTGSGTHSDAQIDLELVYLRKGKNTFLMTNVGSTIPTINGISMDPLAHLTSGSLLTQYGYQLNLENLKPILVPLSSIPTPSPTPTPTAPPAATYAPVGTITYTAENAGIYRVSTDKAVTLINETGSTATMSSGVIKYLYLIKGENKLSTSDLSANITFTALDGYGMSYISKIETAYVPYSTEHTSYGDRSTVGIHNFFVDGDGTYQLGTNDEGQFINVSPGASITLQAEVSADGAGIVYPYLNVCDDAQNTFTVTTDTGFYDDLAKGLTTWQSIYCSDTEQTDMSLVYLREGTNLITIKNTGSEIATIMGLRMSMTGGEEKLNEHETWGPQINLASLKVVTNSSSVEPTATPAPVLPDVSNNELYTVIEAEAQTSGTASSTTYNGKTALAIAKESTASYTVEVPEETIYNLNMVGAAWKDVNFDLYVDDTLVDYATMHFDNDREASAWVYLQEEVAQLHLAAGTHTLKFVFYCDTFYFDSIVLEDTNSMSYHLIHDFKNVTTSEEAYNLLKAYGSAAGIDVEADTAAHAYAPMSFWSMVAQDYESADDMLSAYSECIIDPVVVLKDSNGNEVASLPEGTSYLTVHCMDIPESVSLITAVYQGNKLMGNVYVLTPSNGVATTPLTDVAAGCTLKVLAMSDVDNVKPYSSNGVYANIYVAPNGKTTNAGTEDAPLNTLAAALTKVKTINSDMTGDIIIHMAPGVYRSNVTIAIDQTMGGQNGHKVIIRAEDPNNKPVISGGEDLTGKWSKVSGQNYWVASTSTRETRTLYVNGYQATLARSDGWYSGSYIEPTEPVNEYHVTDGIRVHHQYAYKDFPMNLAGETRMQIVFNLAWANHRFPVESVSYDDTYAYLYTAFPYYNAFCIEGLHTSTITPGSGADFYLENAMGLLDSPGEFYFDKANRKMYYYPYANEDMTTAETYCGVTDFLMEITGVSSSNKVSNLEFDGISFKYGTYDDVTTIGAAFNQTDEQRIGSPAYYGQHLFPAQIQVNYADSLVFKNCEFASLGSSALTFEEGVSNSRVTGSYFHDISGTGMVIGSYQHGTSMASSKERCKNIMVDNNIFRRCAQEYLGLTAISLYYATNVDIHHNDIKDTPYSGIVLGWGWGYDDPAECGDHTISYNVVDNAMQVMGDGAHIYTLGKLYDTQINDNHFIDPHNAQLASAIYFDQGTEFVSACDNVISETTGTDRWLFARFNVNIDNCYVGFNYSDGRSPDSFYSYHLDSNVTLDGNSNNLTSWPTTAQRIMAEAGLEDKTRLDRIDTYPSWRTMRMLDVPVED